MLTDMKNTASRRLLAMVGLVVYAAWVLSLDMLRPVGLMMASLAVAFALPVGLRWLISRKAWSIAAGILLTPCFVAAMLFMASSGDREAMAWYGLVVTWLVMVTAPVFIGISILSAG
jgi:hypothetical protein